MPKPLPQKLIESLRGVTGFDEAAFLTVHQSGRQVTSIRYNPAKISAQQIDNHTFPQAGSDKLFIERPSMPANNAESIKATGSDEGLILERVPWCAAGRYLSRRPSFTLDPFLHGGAYYVQEASSMFTDHAVEFLYKEKEHPKRVLDLCAAPGGKSTLLAARLTNSFIVSNEVIKNRVTILAENISKWGINNIAVTHNDPADFKKLPGFFDLLVVDAPCSGSGLFRKDERAIDEWSEENVTHCSMRQQRILADVVPSLKTGGHLIYSTCSYSPAEDEAICDWLVNSMGLQPVAIPINPSWGIAESLSPESRVPGYRFYPDKVKGEGFFIACFQQLSDAEEKEHYYGKLPEPSKTETTLIRHWLHDARQFDLFKQKETIIALPAKFKMEFATVQHVLHVRKGGVAIGSVKGKDLVPHHELALSGILSNEIPLIDLDDIQAVRYLKRQELEVDTALRGWALAIHKGLALGWVKLLGNRVNNYYPTEWRILKP